VNGILKTSRGDVLGEEEIEMKIEEEFMMFWDDADTEPTELEKLEEKLELKDLKRYTDIRGDKMRYGS
jgi:hypothetical protein